MPSVTQEFQYRCKVVCNSTYVSQDTFMLWNECYTFIKVTGVAAFKSSIYKHANFVIVIVIVKSHTTMLE